MPYSFIASDFPAPSNIIASKDIFILFVLELLAIQINNLAPSSLKFPNCVLFFFLFFEGLIPQTPLWGNLTEIWTRGWGWGIRDGFLLQKEFNLSVSQFPQLFKCCQKIISHFRSGSLSLNEEVPRSANESRYMATRSLNVVIGIPGGPVQIRVSSLRERCGIPLLLQVNSWPFNATSAQFDAVQMCWSFNMVNTGRVW